MSIWDKYPNFSDEELHNLTAISVQVLLDSDSAVAEEVSPELLEMSNYSLADELVPLLQTSEKEVNEKQVERLLEDERLSNQLSLKLLGEMKKYPELAGRINEAYEAKSKMMAEPVTILLIGALVVLAIKLRKFRWNKEGVEVDFEKSGDTVKGFMTELLKGVGF